MHRLSILPCLVIGALCALPAGAAPIPPATAIATADDTAAQRQFAAALAKEHGLDEAAILATLAKARYQQSVIDTVTRPAEAKPWKDYRPIFLTQRRIDSGADFYLANTALLQQVAKKYGVPPQILVAILGVETNYGATPMRYRVLDALTTLAFHYPPRQKYFRSELEQLFLLHSEKFPYPPEDLLGSYAGAMGWPQFMPSSIAHFARDGDDDGKIDLWASLPDICASIANYFEAHGWDAGAPVALRARVAADAKALEPKGLVPAYALQQLEAWGYTIDAQADATKLDPMTPSTIIQLQGADGPEVWITFENFYVISRYNKSPLYSLAVYQLSQAIASAAGIP
jgi:membrane-bound lytic murein transglycosylase B